MTAEKSLKEVLAAHAAGRLSTDDALDLISGLRIEQVGELARIDLGREMRCGIPEVVLAEGKETADLVSIMERHCAAAGRCLATRVTPAQAEEVARAAGAAGLSCRYEERARTLVLSNGREPAKSGGIVGILTAGTADIRVAEEARVVAEEMGCEVRTAYDVGAAGVHRLFPALKDLSKAHVFIVAAGREGTLPAVVAGLVDRPVIGVPVSTGYGYMGQGQAALASMLQSCAVLTVVNIDAGFVAGAHAAQIAALAGRR
ncbi:1-(5-phosphoribosyl)-5-amino-4-imidazole- carboxylate (AIR) carboxylase [Methanofollis liminatans DSM 4140]|uniref:1-(5-phosphoribosyl)-5-amino-4-imidazole-carboxylate (AIR) carboxylase n=1 Tax=Methanofollis liminatans DSM 4140 TaxID=28892 RepID=J0RZ07_9EURY|nr:nickel pincer cofactor biosynthesis protein LarB [Methanofollis liminatans]EJG06801.1 1-(5-phosphoribosyl)-5-amino-4-imidazole- carboxylate (AIR) carboxylase [Methanofollis liminatans DSM 4140]